MGVYNGMPKGITTSLQDPSERNKVTVSKAKWYTKRGIDIVNLDKDSESESRKLFQFIDFSNQGSVTKQDLKLFLQYLET